jgi:hypothetical protein
MRVRASALRERRVEAGAGLFKTREIEFEIWRGVPPIITGVHGGGRCLVLEIRIACGGLLIAHVNLPVSLNQSCNYRQTSGLA